MEANILMLSISVIVCGVLSKYYILFDSCSIQKGQPRMIHGYPIPYIPDLLL